MMFLNISGELLVMDPNTQASPDPAQGPVAPSTPQVTNEPVLTTPQDNAATEVATQTSPEMPATQPAIEQTPVDPVAPQQAAPEATPAPAGMDAPTSPVTNPGTVQNPEVNPPAMAGPVMGTVMQPDAPKKSKKKLVMLIAAILGGLLIIGGGAYAAMTILGSSVKLSTFEDEDLDFTIKYPEGWKTDTVFGYATFTEDGEGKGDYEAAIMVTPLNKDMKEQEGYDSADSLVDQFKKELDDEIKDQEDDTDNFITSYDVKKTKVAGNDAVLVTAQVKNFSAQTESSSEEEDATDNGNGTITVYYVFKDDGIYGVNMFSHETDKKFLKVIDDIAASYTVKEGADSSEE